MKTSISMYSMHHALGSGEARFLNFLEKTVRHMWNCWTII